MKYIRIVCLCKISVQPLSLYGSETSTLRSRDVGRLVVTKNKSQRKICGLIGTNVVTGK